MLRHCREPSEKTLHALAASARSQVARYSAADDLLMYQIDEFVELRIVVPLDDDLRARILHEYHDSVSGGHLGRETMYLALSRDFYWPHMYKWVRKWVRSCETCQRVKPSTSSQAPLRPLPIATDAWRSVSMDFVFGLPADAQGRAGILVVVDRFSKMVHLASVAASITAEQTAAIFLDIVFRHHGMPTSIVSDRDPRFTAAFWSRLFELLGTRLLMSTASHTETDGQTERANRVIEEVLRSYATSFSPWSDSLPTTEFAINNAVHASTGLTPFYVNNARHPRVPAVLGLDGVPALGGGGTPSALASRNTAAASTVASDDKDTPTSSHSTASEADTTAPAAMRTASQGERTSAAASDATASVETPAATASRTTAQDRPKSAAASDADAASTGIHAVETRAAHDAVPIAAPTELPLTAARVHAFVQHRESIALAVDKQKATVDQRGRKHKKFAVGDSVLLSADGIQGASVTNLGASKLAPRFIGPFTVLKSHGDTYTLDIPSAMRLHPTFYVGWLKRYRPALVPSDLSDAPLRVHTAVPCTEEPGREPEAGAARRVVVAKRPVRLLQTL